MSKTAVKKSPKSRSIMRPLEEPIEVRSSRIHGKGLFAVKQIRRGTKIGEYKGKKTNRDGRYVLWIHPDEGKAYGIRGENELRYLNHSATPNSEFDDLSLYAARTIRTGEEITIHYGDDWNDVD